MKQMLKTERIDAVIAGEPVDRIPVSFWRHFYDKEDTGRNLAEAMINFQENYDWDFMKINPRASYHYEDWGAKFTFFRDGLTKPKRTDYPVKKLADLEKIKPLDPLASPVLRDHLDAVHYIKKAFPKNLYLVMTVFTPLSIAADMAETRERFGEYLQEDPKLALQAIEMVTRTFEKFVIELKNIGISGLFFATTHWATYNMLDDRQFDEFSRPFDMRILDLVQDLPFNILHICKSKNMLEKLANYPVQAFNWDAADPSNPGLEAGKNMTGKAVIGGIDQAHALTASTPDLVLKEAEQSLKRTDGRGWILGPGCTYEPIVPSQNLKALREWVEQVSVG